MRTFTKISLIVFVLVGIFSDFIANDKAVICKDENGKLLTVWHDNYPAIAKDKCTAVLYPLIHYSYKTIDKQNAGCVSPFAKQNLKPGQQRHYLGTDELGRDVFAGIIHGTNISLKIGIMSMALSLLLALILGLFPSYYGDTDFKMTKAGILTFLLFAAIILYMIRYWQAFEYLAFSNIIMLILFAGIILWGIKYILEKSAYFSKKITIPLDSTITLFTMLFKSLPGIFLIIIISMFSKPSIYNIIIAIAIIKWPVLTRFIRAEIMKVKNEAFIDSSKALGLPEHKILWRHILPHTITPVLIALSFGFAGTVLLESTLSFLGIGLPADHVSWGTLLSGARHNYSAWWLSIFPGLAIFFTIILFKSLTKGKDDYPL